MERVVRMDNEGRVKMITEQKAVAVRKTGRLRVRLEDDVRADLGRMKIQGWSKMATVRKAWKRFVEQVKTHIKS